MEQTSKLVSAVIDKELCVGHGRCYSVAPSIFESDEEGSGVVRKEFISPEDMEEAEKAIKLCPEEAISLRVRNA